MLLQKDKKTEEVSQNAEVANVEQSAEVAKIEQNSEVAEIEKSALNFDELENAKDEELTEITSGYFTPEVDKVYNFICTGMEEVDNFDGTEGTQKVVAIFDRNRKKFIAGQTMLVNAVERFVKANPQKPIFGVRVKCLSKDKNKFGGTTFVLKVLVF